MNTIDCAALEACLADYLGDELPPADRARCDAHLATCPACRELVQELGSTQSQLRALGGPLEVAEARAVATPSKAPIMHARATPRPAALLAIAAALLAAFSAGFLVGRPAPAQPAITPSPTPLARTPPPAALPRIAQDYLKAAQSAPTASTYGWSLLSIARRS